ncbi:uncharacterized protein [Spinacia oleracea]|uniref:Uncharacterized protein isoform X1 n=1 Tax=Spinacia oleracea TaxID=3562 RepID=A0ABM3R7J1_SPIOL|nr:uncharacterized protein LOC110785350 isoform X1 [Spinacia oleracea]
MALKGDDNDNQHLSNLVHQFSFAKTEQHFIDPELEATLTLAKELRKRVRGEKKCLFLKIQSLKGELKVENLKVLELSDKSKWKNHQIYKLYTLDEYHTKLLKHFPESINENLEEESDPDIELAEIVERIEKLSSQLGHGKTNWATEKQLLKELEPLQRRRSILEPEVKQAEAKVPKPRLVRYPNYEYWQKWRYGSKYELKRNIRKCLKEIRVEYPDFWNEKKLAQRNQRVSQIEKELEFLEERFDILERKEEEATKSVMKLQIQRKYEIDLKHKYCELKQKVQELEIEKDWVLLEELSSKN